MRRLLTPFVFAAAFCLSCLADVAVKKADAGDSAGMQPGTAVVKEILGTASYIAANGQERSLAVGVVLKEGDTVKTGADSYLDLLLPQNGPAVGLAPKTTMKFERLRYRDTDLGVVKQTVLDVPTGALYGHVSKLIGESEYLVRSPKGIVEVKGTDFYYDTLTGNVHVLTGQVFLTIIFDITSSIPPYGGGPLSDLDFAKAVTINAGQSFYMPRGQLKGFVLTAVPTLTGSIPTRFVDRYTSSSPIGLVTTSYDTALSISSRDQFSRAVVSFPPTLVTVSE